MGNASTRNAYSSSQQKVSSHSHGISKIECLIVSTTPEPKVKQKRIREPDCHKKGGWVAIGTFVVTHPSEKVPILCNTRYVSSRGVNKPMDCSLLSSHPILISSASTFSSAPLSWSKRSTDTGTQLLTSLPVLTFGFFCLWLGLGLLGVLTYLQQLLNPIPSSNHFSRKPSEEVEVTHILSRI